MTLVADFNSSVNVPFQRMRALLGESGGGLQAGVVGANDLKVAQRGAGANMSVDVPAGAAWVAITSGTRNGLGHVYNDATANVTVTASNATNPRIDSIILRWNDSSIPTGSGNVPTLEVATGTATAGATLDNRTGAATPTGDFLRLADILVPATSTSVTTANIRDRRPWARGVHFFNTYTGGNVAATVTKTTIAALTQRIECSGVPLEITFQSALTSPAVAGGWLGIWPAIDGVIPASLGDGTQPGPVGVWSGSAAGQVNYGTWRLEFTPAAGSHLLSWQVWASSAAGTVSGTAIQPTNYGARELVVPNATNT